MINLFVNKDLLEYVIENLSSKFCFILYDLLKENKECITAGNNEDPPSFAFKYKNHYIFVGKNAFDYIDFLPKYNRKVFVTSEPNRFSQVNKYFTDITKSDKAGIGNFNKFFTLSCNKDDFYNNESSHKLAEEEVIKLKSADWSINVPKFVKTFLDNDVIIFGIKKHDQIVAVVPAPNIYQGDRVSDFAIIRGVWTLPEYRSKYYSTTILKLLCKHLFEKMSIENIFLWVEQNNPAAIKVYKKVGFKIDDEWYGALCEFR